MPPRTARIALRLTLAPVAQTIEVQARREQLEPYGSSTLSSVTLSASDIANLPPDTEEIIRYAKLMAGIAGGSDAVYVDGLPSKTLPRPEAIAQIIVNADPFSAEYADGDRTHIEIITKHTDRAFRITFNGLPPGIGGQNALSPSQKATSSSETIGASGPIGRLPATFTLRFTGNANQTPEPIVASAPAAPFPGYQWDSNRAISSNQSGWSGSSDVFYDPSEISHFHLSFSDSQSKGVNSGVGGLTLPQAGSNSRIKTQEARLTFNTHWARLLYRGGLVWDTNTFSSNANSDGMGVTVLGVFSAGGAAMTANDSSHTTWTFKNVFQSTSDRLSWTAGATVSGASDYLREIPNASGSFQFPDAQSYLDALDGVPTGTWSLTRAAAPVRYSNVGGALFFQKDLIKGKNFLVSAGVRGDYQSGFGTAPSPRLSAAAQWKGLVMRAGGGLFVRNLPDAVLFQVLQNDGAHFQQYLVPDVSLGGNPAMPSGSQVLIRDQLAHGIVRPSEIMGRASLERSFGKFVPGVEYTWTRDQHLLGSRRLPNASGWYDLLESDRGLQRRRIHAGLTYRLGMQRLFANYERIYSRDDTDGPFSFPSNQDDLRAEWARSAGVSPDNVSMGANLNVRKAFYLTVIESWRDSASYNVTTGLDPASNGLFTDRGGLPRNSGNGPGFKSMSLYASRRVGVPVWPWRPHFKLSFSVGLQGENVLNNRNYMSTGSIEGSPTFGQPLGVAPGRTLRVFLGM